MNISDKTLSVLKNYSNINMSIYIEPGHVLTTRSASGQTWATATVEEDFPKEFAIYELSRFLGTLSLFTTPELSFYDRYVEIREGDKTINYYYADASLIKSQYRNIPAYDPKVSYTITNSDLNQILKASSVLGLPQIAIIGDRNDIFISACDSRTNGGDTFSSKIGKTKHEFVYYLNVDAITLIAGEYNVDATENLMTIWKGDTATYAIMAQTGSYFKD